MPVRLGAGMLPTPTSRASASTALGGRANSRWLESYAIRSHSVSQHNYIKQSRHRIQHSLAASPGSCMLKPGRRRPHLAAPTHCSESHSNDNSSGSVSPPGFSPSSAEISPVEADTDGVQQADSGVLVNRGGNSGGSNVEQRNNLAARFSKGSYGQSTWAKMLLSLPLEVAAAASRADSHYLQKRKRKHWWSKDHFPKVPGEDVLHIKLPQPPISLWQKCIPLALVFFCASFNLTILQNLKDAIVVTAAGAEALPFLASFCVLPASLAFFFAYGRLVEILPHKSVFYASVAPLVAFYAFFASVLYPASVYLHPHGFSAHLAPMVPIGLHGLLKVIETWTFSLFFCVAELWGSVVISVLFWTLANDVCTVADAKTIYPLMGIAANIALVVSGNYMKWVNSALAGGSLQLSLQYLVSTVVVMSGVMMAAKLYIDRNIHRDEKEDVPAKPRKAKSKRKGSIADSWAVLKSSPKILNLALLVVSYGVSHRLFEFAWKGQLGVLYPSAQQYQGVLADVSIATGWATIALMVGGRFVFQYLGWGFAASATPAVMLLTGGAFFGLSIAARLSPSSLHLASAGVLAGAVTQVFARSSKFSLFDPAKEMVYIEMNKEEKSKGKAAVDLLGSQIGKSGASWLTQALLLCTGSIQAALPIIAAVFAAVIACWLRAVSTLGTTIQREEAEAEAEKVAAAAAAAAEAEAQVMASEAADAEVDGEGDANHTGSQFRWPGDVTDALDQASAGNHGGHSPSALIPTSNSNGANDSHDTTSSGSYTEGVDEDDFVPASNDMSKVKGV